MKQVESLLIALMLMFNVSFGYTLTITYNGTDTVREVEGGESVIVGLSSRDEADYVVDSNNAILKIFGNRRQFVMPEGDVNITISHQSETLKSVLDIQVGDYVTYYPTETVCDLSELTGIEQDSLNPSEATLWRVLKNNGTTVELISANNVGYLTLGRESLKMEDDNFSVGASEDFELTKQNYAGGIEILNTISEAYINSEMAVSSRGLGYNGTAVEVIDTTENPLTHSSTLGVGYNGEPYTDDYYEEDINVLVENNMLPDQRFVWLTSRVLELSWGSFFSMRGVTSSGAVDSFDLFHDYSDGRTYSFEVPGGIRPIVALKDNLTVVGEGTSEIPYALVSSNGHIVTFVSNGGNQTLKKEVEVGSIYGSLPTPSKTGYVFDGWYKDSELTVEVTSNTIVETVGNHTLYAKWEPAFESKAQVGDYVTYHPTTALCNLTTLTGITQSSLTPSSTTEWRVLSNDGTNVELISANSVGNLTLSKDARKESDGTYSIGTESDLTVSKSNYANIVNILREISCKYADPNITNLGRGLGWNGVSERQITTPITYEYVNANATILVNKDSYDDGYYRENNRIEDVQILVDNEMVDNSGYIWLASRGLDVTTDTSVNFSVRSIDANGDVYIYYVIYEDSNGYINTISHTTGIRPVVILKSGLKATGSGTEADKWVIEN